MDFLLKQACKWNSGLLEHVARNESLEKYGTSILTGTGRGRGTGGEVEEELLVFTIREREIK